MYIPNSFAERDRETLFAFMEAYPLATLVTTSETGLFATHLPLLVNRDSGPMGTLFGHIARANAHSRYVAAEGTQALVIFTGPDAYITPEWYRTKQETGRVVPTWNYIAVHVYGSVRLRDDASFLRPHLEALTRQHEGSRPTPWHVSDAPPDYIEQQLKAIVGVELEIDRLEGKWKMSQNRVAADIDGVIRGLGESEVAQDRAVAAIVRERRPAKP
jgi:transcriptional regulator